MIREEILRDIESFTAGLDDTFKFHCTQCGKCCIERDDIMLSPMDIFKIAKELKISPHAFFYKYCTRVIGTHSRVPIVMLRPVGKNHRCPLLKNNKCAVHNVKPAVCGMFPLGRYIVLSPENYNKESFAGSEVKYLLQPIECGDDSETHTVREWLSGFDISLEDKAFVRWHQAIAEIGPVLQALEKKWDPFTMMEVWFVVQITLYQNYDTEKDFMPQFEENIAGVLDILQDIPRIKEAVRRATRA